MKTSKKRKTLDWIPACMTVLTKAQYDILRLAGFTTDEAVDLIVRYRKGERAV